jgi:hypothetical protein
MALVGCNYNNDMGLSCHNNIPPHAVERVTVSPLLYIEEAGVESPTQTQNNAHGAKHASRQTRQGTALVRSPSVGPKRLTSLSYSTATPCFVQYARSMR